MKGVEFPLAIECTEIERRAEHNSKVIGKIREILKKWDYSSKWDTDAFRAIREIEDLIDEFKQE